LQQKSFAGAGSVFKGTGMTVAQFRQIALGFPGVTEGSHVDHPDFRANGKIYATLGYPNERYGVLMLTPEEQAEAMGRHPREFDPVKGGWGRKGNTRVLLEAIGTETLKPWMELAWRRAAAKKSRRRKGDTDS
jgi:hypothetical protein